MPVKGPTARILVPKPSSKERLDEDASINKGRKSHNGCLTCKAKRMKCDETKPTCRHCARRGISCGGYAKTGFKWKHFVDPETGTRTQTDSVSPQPLAQAPDNPPSQPASPTRIIESPTVSECFNVALESLTRDEPSSARFIDVDLPPDDQDNAWDMKANDASPIFDSSLFSSTLPMNETTMVDDVLSGFSTSELQVPDDQLQLAWADASKFENSSYSQASNVENDIISQPHDLVPLYQEPQINTGHIDVITSLFNRKTCGVLSVKDSCDDNPWRSLIWPLAKHNPALRHAIAAMTCLHFCTQRPELHAQGLSHLRQSIQQLREGIENRAIRTDAALATTLALSLARTWEAPRTRTGFSHLKEAKLLLKQAVAGAQCTQVSKKRARRLKFLANTWIYMDVITRLTALDPTDTMDTELIAACSMLEDQSQQKKLDPLMGCASELFPLLGRAADLVRQIWEDGSKRESAPMIAQAAEVMRSVETWTAKINHAMSDDPAYIVQDAEQTAEAYRWAIFLMLRQAIPTLPGYMTHEQLAQKVLIYLATVPLSSGTVIVHTFPLLIAGCEVASHEDRSWVKERWTQMASIMISGVTDRCLELTAEAWRRKDIQARSRTSDNSSLSILSLPSEQSTPQPVAHDDLFNDLEDVPNDLAEDAEHTSVADDAPTRLAVDQFVLGSPNPDANKDSQNTTTIRNRLNWLAIMHDWKWQVMLG